MTGAMPMTISAILAVSPRPKTMNRIGSTRDRRDHRDRRSPAARSVARTSGSRPSTRPRPERRQRSRCRGRCPAAAGWPACPPSSGSCAGQLDRGSNSRSGIASAMAPGSRQDLVARIVGVARRPRGHQIEQRPATQDRQRARAGCAAASPRPDVHTGAWVAVLSLGAAQAPLRACRRRPCCMKRRVEAQLDVGRIAQRLAAGEARCRSRRPTSRPGRTGPWRS